jgi:hypothetical protein
MEPKYRFTLSEDALGVVVDLHGPGMPTPPYGVHTQQHLNSWAEEIIRTQPARASCETEAERIVALLDAAYEAGKRARSEELRELLGVKP